MRLKEGYLYLQGMNSLKITINYWVKYLIEKRCNIIKYYIASYFFSYIRVVM